MGNNCIIFRRRKRLQEELDFRRRMEERIHKSSKRLKTIPPDELTRVVNGSNDLGNNLRNRHHKLDQDKPACTPLRLNSQGQFVEIDQQFIQEQLNNLNDLDRRKVISNQNLDLNLNTIQNIQNLPVNRSLNVDWSDPYLSEKMNHLSRLNQLHLLQSISPYKLNSFDNQSFVNTSIDNNLFDHNLINKSFQTNQLSNQLNNGLNLSNQQMINNQLSLSINSYNSNLNLINKNQLNNHQPNDNLFLQTNLDHQLNNLDQKNYLNGSQSNQLICNNVLDAAADRIFFELEYMDNRFTNGNQLNYLPLDGLTTLNSKSRNFNHRFSTNFNTQSPQQMHFQQQLQPVNLSNLNLNNANQISNFNNQHTISNMSVNQITNHQPDQLVNNSKMPFSDYFDIEKSLNDNIKEIKPPNITLELINENLVMSAASATSSTLNTDNSSNKKDLNSKEDLSTKDCSTLNASKISIEEEEEEDEEKKDELNDSGNISGSGGCQSKQITRAESMENKLINSQIEMEPWFFAQINTRNAAEHVLRMKGNRTGAFLVRHAQKIKFTPDAPYVLSLKVAETQSTNDKPYEKHINHFQSNVNYFNEHQFKTSKDILHYKIYSQLTCPNCELIVYYINPGNQFNTIRQLISFYSDNENCGLPIKLEKPCLPFDFQNCCQSLSSASANSPANVNSRVKLSCEICNELMSNARANRWSTGNLSNTGTHQQQASQSTSISSSEACFQNYIEQNPDSFVKLVKDDALNNTNAHLLSKSLNSIRATSVDRISSNGGMPVNSTNRILTDIKFENQLNKLSQLHNHSHSNRNSNRFSTSLDDVGLNNSGNSSAGLSSRLSLKDKFRNRSLASINHPNDHHLTSSGSSLSRKSSDSSRKPPIRTGSIRGSLIGGGYKYRISSSSSSSFKENICVSSENLVKRRSSSIRLKAGNNGKLQLRKVNSYSVNNVSSLKNSNS